MLISQITPSARNIPTFAPEAVQTREPKQCMWEDLLISGRSLCGRFNGMAEAARLESQSMKGGGGWRYLDHKQAASRGKQSGIKAAILALLADSPRWWDRREICDALQLPSSPVGNALYALVTEGKLDKRVMPKGKFSSGNIGQWRRKEGDL